MSMPRRTVKQSSNQPASTIRDARFASQFGGASEGAFGQVAFGQRLHSRGDAFDQPGAVAGLGGFAEKFGEALSQLADAQPLERRDLVVEPELYSPSRNSCVIHRVSYDSD
jgi:hypothetical protein